MAFELSFSLLCWLNEASWRRVFAYMSYSKCNKRPIWVSGALLSNSAKRSFMGFPSTVLGCATEFLFGRAYQTKFGSVYELSFLNPLPIVKVVLSLLSPVWRSATNLPRFSHLRRWLVSRRSRVLLCPFSVKLREVSWDFWFGWMKMRM